MPSPLSIPSELLHKYNVQGPRYTSYPPAPSWTTAVGPADYEKALADSAATPRPAPLSLYFHLPFCEKLCYFCGCTTLITGKNRSFEEPYWAALIEEIDWLSSRVKGRAVTQLHLGGGTPTYSSPKALETLMETVWTRFQKDADAEVGVEVDPRVTTAQHLRALRAAGFNRLSMGVQDFNPEVQRAVNRIQPIEQTRALVEAARALGFASINIDLIYGLPYQTPDSFAKTVESVMSLNPDRLAVYSYAHVPWLKTHQDVFAAHLPDERQKFDIFQLAMKKFTEAGFEYIGMDHFAKPDDELARAREKRTLWRNFQGYTTKAGTELLGLGMSAIGQVHGSFFQNEKDIQRYQAAWKAKTPATARGFPLSPDDKVRARVIQNLLCHAVVVKSEIERDFGVAFDAYFLDALEKLKGPESDGLVKLDENEIRATPLGRVFLRNLAMAFDAYLPKEGEKRVFSRTV